MNSIADAKRCSIQRRPTRMLKEFLRDDDSSSNSCSSSDPNRQPPPPPQLPRSRSRSRAAVTSFQKLLISAVKSLHRISPSSSSSPPPETLQRSLSKRLLTKFRRSKESRSGSSEGKIIKVKDILRWRSFRDEDKPPQSDSPATAVTTTTTSGSREEYSLEDSEFSFTAEELPRWCGKGKKVWNNDVDVVDGGDPVRETTGAMDVPELGPEEGEREDNIASEEEKEQHSPVSVLNSPFRDEVSDEEVTSSFDQSLANVERTKQRLLQSIKWFESLAGVDEQSSQDDDSETADQEEEGKGEEEEEEEDLAEGNASKAKSRDYMFKVLSRLTREGQGVKSKDCIKDMDREGQWSKFGEEREEVGEELEACLLHDLVDDILVDLFG